MVPFPILTKFRLFHGLVILTALLHTITMFFVYSYMDKKMDVLQNCIPGVKFTHSSSNDLDSTTAQHGVNSHFINQSQAQLANNTAKFLLGYSTVVANNEWKSHPKLKHILSRKLHEETMSLMEMFLSLCEKYGVTFVMADGTLFGSYFFHNTVPWDDGLDVIVKYSDTYKLMKAFADPDFQEDYSVQLFQSNISWYSIESFNKMNMVTHPPFPH